MPNAVTIANTVANTRWARDKRVDEVCRYFNQPRYVPNPHTGTGDWDALTNADWDVIAGEINACRENYIYAARNYFWITDKSSRDILFTPNESQEIVLERIFEIRARGLAQLLIILKARQLGISSLVQGLLSWGTFYNANKNSIIVAPDRKLAGHLFETHMMHIYDHLPWWMKPMIAQRKTEIGLILDNPEQSQRGFKPGLNSMVLLQSSKQSSGVGQGVRISMAHISEISDMRDEVAREIIQADLGNALAVESADTMAVIESTARGAGRYYHTLFKKNKEAGVNAEWQTVFIPAFMERSRFIAPEGGWQPHKIELEYREAVQDTWLRCDNATCQKYKEATDLTGNHRDSLCLECKKGRLRRYVMTDGQLRWLEKRRRDAEMTGSKSIRDLRQEMACTDSEAFQLSGNPVFSEAAISYAALCKRDPILQGFIDETGDIHGMVRKPLKDTGMEEWRCYQPFCSKNHTYDQHPLKVWEFPEEGHEYAIGVDVSPGGGGDSDYSVISVIRIGKGANADAQVAVWRSNEINHYDLSRPVVQLGHTYNEALVCIEYNTLTSCADNVVMKYEYPNIYRRKHLNSSNVLSNVMHWMTNQQTKPRLWGEVSLKIESKLVHIRSHNTVEEMKTFRKENGRATVEATGGDKDDEIMATMIAIVCAHELDSEPGNFSRLSVPLSAQNVVAPKKFELNCLRCGKFFEGDHLPDGMDIKCVSCGSIMLKAKRNGINSNITAQDAVFSGKTLKKIAQILGGSSESGGERDYNEL